MHPKKRIIGIGISMTLFILFFLVETAGAITYNLAAGPTTLIMPDGAMIPAWGFGVDGGPIKVPGDPLVIPPGESNLTINLTNNLPEPVSLHILGQRLSNNTGPVFTEGLSNIVVAQGARPAGNNTARVRSFTHETAPGDTGTYIWSNFKPGTYMLQSATNPAKQVQMGLYAAVYRDFAGGEAYPGISYDKNLLVVYHELDPVIHQAVSEDRYGAGASGVQPHITSSIFREPAYFLINGKGFPDGGLNPINADMPVGTGQNLLVRFVNAGLTTHVPQFLNLYMSVVAEDGVPYRFPKQMCSFELSAAKTMDAIIQPGEGGYALLDAMLNLTNAGASPGGMLALLNAVPLCEGDLDGNGAVDVADLSIFSASFGSAAGDPNYNEAVDLNGDGRIDVADLSIFAEDFLRTGCP